MDNRLGPWRYVVRCFTGPVTIRKSCSDINSVINQMQDSDWLSNLATGSRLPVCGAAGRPALSGAGRVNPERSARTRPWRTLERGGSFVGCARARPKRGALHVLLPTQHILASISTPCNSSSYSIPTAPADLQATRRPHNHPPKA